MTQKVHHASTEDEAARTAARINRYWAERGWDAGAYVTIDRTRTPCGKYATGFVVRTLLVDGMPTRKLRTVAA